MSLDTDTVGTKRGAERNQEAVSWREGGRQEMGVPGDKAGIRKWSPGSLDGDEIMCWEANPETERVSMGRRCGSGMEDGLGMWLSDRAHA